MIRKATLVEASGVGTLGTLGAVAQDFASLNFIMPVEFSNLLYVRDLSCPATRHGSRINKEEQILSRPEVKASS